MIIINNYNHVIIIFEAETYGHAVVSYADSKYCREKNRVHITKLTFVLRKYTPFFKVGFSFLNVTNNIFLKSGKAGHLCNVYVSFAVVQYGSWDVVVLPAHNRNVQK